MTFFKKISWPQTLFFLSLIVFVLLAFFANGHPHFSFDLSITQKIQSFRPFWFDTLMRFLSFIGMSTVDILSVFIFSLFLLILNKKREAQFLFITSYGLNLLGIAFKAIVARPRPDPTLIFQLENFTKPTSFPSGHVLYAIGFYGFLFFLTLRLVKIKPLQYFLLFTCASIVLLMGLSRVYVGAHWFTDITGSYLLGFPWLFMMIKFYDRQTYSSSNTE